MPTLERASNQRLNILLSLFVNITIFSRPLSQSQTKKERLNLAKPGEHQDQEETFRREGNKNLATSDNAM